MLLNPKLKKKRFWGMLLSARAIRMKNSDDLPVRWKTMGVAVHENLNFVLFSSIFLKIYYLFCEELFKAHRIILVIMLKQKFKSLMGFFILCSGFSVHCSFQVGAYY